MLKNQIESILFISNKPLTIKQLADICNCGKAEVETIAQSLKEEYNQNSSGIKIIEQDNKVQMVTAPESKDVVEKFLKQELTGEMTRPQLEALTIIAYRGPVSKMELEQIRGVNCSLILRNLMIRGLVEAYFDKKLSVTMYQVTLDFIKHLGLTKVQELPDYERLSSHEIIQDILQREMDKKTIDSVHW